MRLIYTLFLGCLLISPFIFASDYHNFSQSWGVSGKEEIRVGSDGKKHRLITLIEFSKLDSDIILKITQHFPLDISFECNEYRVSNKNQKLKSSEITIAKMKVSAITMCSPHNQQEGKIGNYTYIAFINELPKLLLNSFIENEFIHISTPNASVDLTTQDFLRVFEQAFGSIYEYTPQINLVTKSGNFVVGNDGFPFRSKSMWNFYGQNLMGIGFLKNNFFSKKTIFDEPKGVATFVVTEELIILEVKEVFSENLFAPSCKYVKDKGTQITINGAVLTHTYAQCNKEKKSIEYFLSTSNENHKILEAFKGNNPVRINTPFHEFYFDVSNFPEQFAQIEIRKTTPYSPLNLNCVLQIGEPVYLNIDIDLLAKTANKYHFAIINDSNIAWIQDNIHFNINRYSGVISYSPEGESYQGKCTKLTQRAF